jgi:hypothetical protein
LAPLEGAYGKNTASYVEGLQVWARQVNAAGGIHGRQIVIKTYPNDDTTDSGVAACKKAVADNDTFFPIVVGTAGELAAANCLNQSGVVTMAVEGDPSLQAGWSHIYLVYPNLAQQGATLANYTKTLTTPGQKIAIATASDFQVEGTAAASQAQTIGLNVVNKQSLDEAGTSFIPQLERMKSSGATAVMLMSLSIETALLKEAKTIGYSPEWIGDGFGWDYIPQGSPGLFDGVHVLQLLYATDNPGYSSYVTLQQQYASPSLKCTAATCQLPWSAYGLGLLAGQVLQAAGQNPTQGALPAAFQSVKNFNAQSYPPVTWGPNQFTGATAMPQNLCCQTNNAWKTAGPAVPVANA